MDINQNRPGKAKLDVWTKEQTAAGVKAILNLGVIDSMVAEAKATWILPYQILIGKLRPQGRSNEFVWFIYGEIKTDYLNAKAADTAREAARHFAMKWQIEATRSSEITPPGTEAADEVKNPQAQQLALQAEALYELTEDDRAWAS